MLRGEYNNEVNNKVNNEFNNKVKVKVNNNIYHTYSAKFWRWKTLANLVNWMPFANILSSQIQLKYFFIQKIAAAYYVSA